MCKTRMSIDAISPRKPSSQFSRASKSRSSSEFLGISSSSAAEPSSSYNKFSSSTSISSLTSPSSLKVSLPENAHIYEFSEIRSATKNFLAKPFSSSSSSVSWKCTIRRREVIIFQRKIRCQMETSDLKKRLQLICRSHHVSIIKLLGASISGNHIYLVYEFIKGVNLSTCLRNPRNPNFTILSNWISRMQIADDLAHGLDYVHNFTSLDREFIHNFIKPSSILVTEENNSLSAKISHFGTTELTGELRDKIEVRSETKFEGTRGYMSPELLNTGISTQKSDVYAFGVVILELLSGDEALNYRFDERSGGYERVSVIETAREAVGDEGRLRKWIDRRLKDSFPVDVAERMVRVGLDCVEENPEKRPDMGWVSGRVSMLFLESKSWVERMGVPVDFSVSFAPR
ncbi:Serine-threonine/tyrosine-protein kinase, catalytic domain [Dillenia turbinata]|uniref:Serine-threonine/tyrosine-protein kinase, catalytic domain n=1 Tax=Dillenia turbinata TaxID=194707 RepID=A0AAN8VCN9_9MAGN